MKGKFEAREWDVNERKTIEDHEGGLKLTAI